jgi:hypothetical protein
MDPHAREVMASVLDCLARYERGAASLTELQAATGAAAVSLDNANVDLRVGLERLGPDLEEIVFTVPVADQPAAVSRAFSRVRHLP